MGSAACAGRTERAGLAVVDLDRAGAGLPEPSGHEEPTLPEQRLGVNDPGLVRLEVMLGSFDLDSLTLRRAPWVTRH